jgi:hypothetical protein
MYTTQYTQHLAAMELAQTAFDKKPCRETATKLSNLREKRVDMYTQEEMAKRETMKQKADKAFWMEMTDLMFDVKRGI